MGTQTRQANGSQSPAPRSVRQFSRQGGRSFRALRRTLCPYARCRHRIATGKRPSHGGCHGASSQSGHHRSCQEHREFRLWNPSASARRQRSKHISFPSRRFVCRRDRSRHLHARCFGCLPGPIWRRHIYRQGNLRSRNRTPGSRAPLPSQCLVESRSDRRRLRARRSRQRYRDHRRLSLALQRLQPEEAPLAPRRLADRELALLPCTGRVGSTCRKSDLARLSLENSG